MISPTEVSNMAFVPTDQSLNQTNQFYAQLAAQQQARNQAQKAQQQANEVAFNNKLLEQISASNTPADEVLIDEGSRIVGDISKFSKENPRASMAQKSEYARQALTPYLARKEMAKSVFGQLEASSKEQAKMYPYANMANYKKDVARDILYDAQGNPRPSYNMGALQDPRYNLADVNVMDRYADDAALDPLLQKAYKEGLPLEEKIFATKDPQGLMVDVKTKATPLQRLNKNLSGLELNTMPVDVNGKIYNVLPFDVNIPIKDKPEYEIKKRRTIKNLVKQDPNLEGADEEFLSSLADTELAKRYSMSEDTKLDMNYKRQEMADDAAYKAEQLKLARDRNALSREKFAFDKKRINQQLKTNANSPQGIYDAIVGATKFEDGSPISEEAEKLILTKYRVPLDNATSGVFNVAKDYLSKETKAKLNKLPKLEGNKIDRNLVSPFVSIADLSSSVKNGLFLDNKTLKPYKLYSVYDNEGGVEPKMVKVYYTKEQRTPAGLQPAAPEGDPILIKDPKQELLLIGDQVMGTNQKQREAQYEPIMTEEEY